MSKTLKDNSVSGWGTLFTAINPFTRTSIASDPFGKWASGQKAEIDDNLDDYSKQLRATDDPKKREALKEAIRKWLADKFDGIDKAIASGVKGQFVGLDANKMSAAASAGGADYSAVLAAQRGAREYFSEASRGAQLQFASNDLNGRKGDLTAGVEQRKQAEETMVRLARELAQARESQLGAMERIDLEQTAEVQNLARTHQQTQANLEIVDQIYDAKRLAEYNKLMQESVSIHLSLGAALKKISTEEATVAVYGPQFADAVKQMEDGAKAAAKWAEQYNKITAATDNESIRHRVAMAGANGNANDPLGTLANQQAIERLDIETRYEEKLKVSNTDLDKSIALREKELELQKLQDEIEERTAAARHKNLADFMREMQGQSKTLGDILYDGANSGLDRVSDQFARLITGQKTSFGEMFKSIGEEMTKESVKSGLQKGLGALGKKLGIHGPDGKPDGTEGNPFWVISKDKLSNPLAGMIPSLPPAAGGSAGNFIGTALKGIGGFLGGLFGGGGGSQGMSSSSITYMASGGDMSPGRVYGVAEAGEAELVSPKNSSRITPLSKLTGGGDVHYNIDARGADFGAKNRVARAIEAAHNSAVQNSVRANAEHARRLPRKKR